MRIREVGWTAFRIPLVAPLRTSRGETGSREGLIVRLYTDEGLEGIGEASYTPGRPGGDLESLMRTMSRAASSVAGGEVEETRGARGLPGPGTCASPARRAVAAGLDIALCDLCAKQAGVSLARWLARGEAVAASVPVGALLAARTRAEAHEEAVRAGEAGFGTVKLKVGTGAGLAAERELVAAVRDAVGRRIRIRLDANGAWSERQAIRAIRDFAPLDLELVEQPVAPGRLEAMRRVRDAVAVPLAADEDVAGVETAQRVLDCGAAQVLVVKPLAVGCLRAAGEILALAADRGAASLVTTTIDTGVGTAAALHLAALLEESAPASGLATAGLLESDLLAEPVAIAGGRISLPVVPGLGVELDRDLLDGFAVAGGSLAA